MMPFDVLNQSVNVDDVTGPAEASEGSQQFHVRMVWMVPCHPTLQVKVGIASHNLDTPTLVG